MRRRRPGRRSVSIVAILAALALYAFTELGERGTSGGDDARRGDAGAERGNGSGSARDARGDRAENTRSADAAPPPATAARRQRAASTRSAGAAATAPAAAASGEACVVEAVSDGDTIRCADGRRVRLLLIDAPERSQAPFGARAREALLRLAPIGSRLRVEHDVRPTDRYGRTLAYLWREDGRMVNHAMVRDGYAVVLVYPPNVRYVDELRAAADSARRQRRGLHETDGFACEPREHRRGNC